MKPDRVVRVRCVVVGGGPAGIMLGFLLARSGVDVIVLEKHADFLRDFRGDTIHPSTLQLFAELGLAERFLQLPHSEVSALTVRFGETALRVADFTHLPGAARYLAFMPQSDFLDFLAAEAKRYPTFALETNTDVVDLVYAGRRVAGVTARSPQGTLEVRADLVIAADGRTSTLRERAGLPLRDLGAPIDVLWMRLSRHPDDPPDSFGNIAAGGILITINRNDYYQCAFVIRKGGMEAIRAGGLPAFRSRVAELAPFLAGRVAEIAAWDDVKVLTVRVDRLRRWYRDGLLCIGDAAHAMSPVGGVGINLAIQDAVAAANLLAAELRNGPVSTRRLRAVQRRREWPARVVQTVQVALHKNVLERILATTGPPAPPLAARVLDRFSVLRGIPAYAVGIGPRPEHVRSPREWEPA
jgi:2-polyprenyl-6-methoxyphenol hydroxylase-like FAD-dependent oxidoreductase